MMPDKVYVLDMFPYPSGKGLHFGHTKGYFATDTYARYKRLAGFDVIHPMGFDSFGLPAEQYARETGMHPAKSTTDNMNNITTQMFKLNLLYDIDKWINTSDFEYYKWTQHLFLLMYESWYDLWRCSKQRRSGPGCQRKSGRKP